MSSQKIRIATFNVENLLTRYDFKGRKARGRGLFGLMKRLGQRRITTGQMNASRFELEEADRLATAYAVRDLAADIVCMQEVESLEVLADFERNYLKPLKVSFPNQVVKEGNDVRGIDVAAMARDGISIAGKSNHDIRYSDFNLYNDELAKLGVNPKDRTFKRDCLELTVDANGNELTIFVCHFKSMRMSRAMEAKFGSKSDGRVVTSPIRAAEAAAVKRLVTEKFGAQSADAPWIICGDLNDHAFLNAKSVDDFSSQILLKDNFARNVVASLKPEDRWTHYYKPHQKFSQLDYLLLSPALAEANKSNKPRVLRSGMPLRVPGLTDITRYEGIGWNRPKSSDHCPLSIELSLL